MTFATRSAVVFLAGLLGSFSANAQQIPGVTRSFYGMAYSPEGALLPNCGATQAAVTRDMANVAQFTPRIRLYGSDCNQTALVLQGIKDAGNVDLSVWLGIFIDGNDTVYQRQMDAVTDAIKNYGVDHIAGITVGNEYLLLSYGDSGSATDPKGVAARTTLLNYIKKTNQTLQAMKLPKSIPLGTADAGSAVTKELCAGADYVMANVHPWFGKVPIADAATWTWQFYQDFDVKICAQAPNNPIMYIAETGWPTTTDNASMSAAWPSGPSNANLQTFLDTFICPANANGTNYFFFEYKDEIWKKVYGGVEPYWGLFDTNLKLKDLKFPSCPVQSPTNRAVVVSSSAATNTGSGITPIQGSAKKSSAPRREMQPLIMSSLLIIIGLLVLL
ncbi:family 17 glycoside hydrolase [Melampsora larici-populina 98AG31]|uniref:glucan endo-1,3-beta-D-glucosidase n=1 Tax=Melampsora larici-populina (strain 98AG31 / pathotype 3-4-7) TaxID=747676 RepID=F4RLE0_MELLP|nr:family 17 glycoside hydrolase [Melampsora larici-populina 98AG31]EGG07014.1 family 17 glycoside hydrolase [Melampsora larici-populina 98AG31]